MAENLELLPLNDGAQQGLTPASPVGSAAQSGASAHASADLDDAVERYMSGASAETKTPTPDEGTPPIPADNGSGGPQARDVVEETNADLEVTPATPQAETKPLKTDKAPVGEMVEPGLNVKPTETQPAAPKYADDEKFVLGTKADGEPIEWTRAQVRQALIEQQAAAPFANDGRKFREIFGMDAARAETEWKPILERLVAEPNTAALIEGYLNDPGLADYLDRSAEHFAAQRAAGVVPPPPQKPAKPGDLSSISDPVLRQEIEATRRWREESMQQEATARVNREVADLVRRWPFLAEKKNLDDLLLSASALWEQDRRSGVPENQRRGIPEAAEARAELYDAALASRKAQEVPDVAPPAIPATLGSVGAQPTVTKRGDTRPRVYADLGDAVERHLQEHPE